VLSRPPLVVASIQALTDLLRRPTLAPILVANVVLGLGVSFVTPFLSMFGTKAVGMSLSGFGVFMTVNACANIAIATWIARRSDRGGQRRSLLLLGGFAGAVGYAGYAFVRDYWMLTVVGTLILGVGSITFAQLYAHTREVLGRSDLPAQSAPLYMNTCRMAFAFAWTGGPALAAWTLARHGFTGLFLAAAALHVLFVVVVAFGMGTLSLATPSSALAPSPPPSLPTQPLWSPGLIRWFCGFVLIFTAQTMALMNLPLFTLESLAGTEFQVAVMFSLAPCFEVPLMLYVGWLATRLDAGRLIRTASVVAFLYYAGLTLVGEPWHVYPLQLLSAAVISVMGGVAITFFQDKLPGQAGQATNLYGSASRVGATLGYLAFGVSAATLGHRGTYGVCAGLTALAFGLMPGPMAAAGAPSARQS
jgi:MFS transporter, SET family, sugar efflux transporter